MRAKFKVLSGERLCEKAFGVNLGEFGGSKSAFASEAKNLKSTLTSEFNGLKSVLASKITNKAKNSKSAFVGEFDSYENAVASQKGALMSAFKTHLSELKRAFASLCERTKFKNERVKKKLWRRNFSLSLSLSRWC